MGDYGIKVTSDGHDISSSEPRDFILNSAYSTVKIALMGSGSINISPNSSATVQIPHGLSFKPLALFFSELDYNSGKWFSQGADALGTPDIDQTDSDTDSCRVASASVDATNLNITYNNYHNSDTKTVRYYYFIFGDTGE